MTRSSVPISYESRIAKLSLNEAELPKVDSEFEEITEGEEVVLEVGIRRSRPLVVRPPSCSVPMLEHTSRR